MSKSVKKINEVVFFPEGLLLTFLWDVPPCFDYTLQSLMSQFCIHKLLVIYIFVYISIWFCVMIQTMSGMEILSGYWHLFHIMYGQIISVMQHILSVTSLLLACNLPGYCLNVAILSPLLWLMWKTNAAGCIYKLWTPVYRV